MAHLPEHVSSTVGPIGYPHDWESIMTNVNHSNVDYEQAQPQNNVQSSLSEAGRKRKHNHSRALEQRSRYYRTETQVDDF
ncbi:unnamed protein product [Adineta steineri]|uniref:Uncharacterized protein n=1 Tax=Adineta steineri TaxID=433720 RepID=A0A815X802_9BILA|nr:unnamed protein product [Adineta steineri]CAF1554135.1 unnamed protein product [Adineta steineri]